MKRTKVILGLAGPALVALAIGSKVRLEHIENSTAIATVIKVIYRPIFKWAAGRVLRGRYFDRRDPEKGRITNCDVQRIVERTWRNYDVLVPGAHAEQLRTFGSRQNVLLAVASLAMFRALVAEGIDKEYATELFTDLAWTVYEKWIALPRSIARLSTRDPQRQMDTMLEMFLTYPFSRPGYDWKVHPGSGVFAVDFYRCPVLDYFKTQDEEEFCRNSWCTLDYALALVMTKGGYYERSRTLSDGDDVCEMKWYAGSK